MQLSQLRQGFGPKRELPASASLVVVGAGAAGLMAAIQAAQGAKDPASVLVLDGAKRVGAKILVSGGTRCNLTNASVAPSDFFGSKPKAIERILRRFDHLEARSWFEARGLSTREEPRGKIFPESDRAKDVLGVLLEELWRQGASLISEAKVVGLRPLEEGIELELAGGKRILAERVCLAPGGKSLPKTGSDGTLYAPLEELGVPVVRPLLPALVGLVDASIPGLDLAGLALPASLTLEDAQRRILARAQGDLLFTHQGISGPAALDLSRHWIRAQAEGHSTQVRLRVWPEAERAGLARALPETGRTLLKNALSPPLPSRLAEVLLELAEIPRDRVASQLPRAERKRLEGFLFDWPLGITGDGGFAKAEVTSGGVPLSALKLKTLELKALPRVYLAGEILDVDGRLGGFNFQWAWSSGFVAGRAMAEALG